MFFSSLLLSLSLSLSSIYCASLFSKGNHFKFLKILFSSVYIASIQKCLSLGYLFIYYLFWAALGLRCCIGSSLVAGGGDCSLGAVLRLLMEVASLVAKHRPQGTRPLVVAVLGLSSCGTQPYLPCSLWNPPGSGIEPVSTLAGDS